MKNLIIYVHGKGGSSGEAKKEFFAFFTTQRSRFEHIILVANSIGSFFGISSLDETLVDRAYLISPIVDMEKTDLQYDAMVGGDRTGTCLNIH